MTFELATQLEEAGFGCTAHCQYQMFDHPELGPVFRHVPTLSELIEACGDNFYELRKRGFGVPPEETWVSQTSYGMVKEPEITCGKTPAEAVARLWLALNAS